MNINQAFEIIAQILSRAPVSLAERFAVVEAMKVFENIAKKEEKPQN